MPFPPILCLIGFPFLPRERFQTISISLLGISFPFFFSNSKENVSSCVIINRQPRCITRIEKSNFQLNNIISRIVFFFFFFLQNLLRNYRSTSNIHEILRHWFLHPLSSKSNENIFFYSLSFPLSSANTSTQQPPPPKNLKAENSPPEKEISKEPRLKNSFR